VYREPPRTQRRLRIRVGSPVTLPVALCNRRTRPWTSMHRRRYARTLVCLQSQRVNSPRMAKMINLEISRRMQLRVCGLAAACTMMAASLGAQKVNPRIPSEIGNIGNADHSNIAGSLNPHAQPQFDTGRLPSGTRINGITIVFNRTAQQEADLKALIAAQQDPASPLYHQWLSPINSPRASAWPSPIWTRWRAGSSNRVFPSIPWPAARMLSTSPVAQVRWNRPSRPRCTPTR